MNATGFKRDTDCCKSRFQQLYSSYQAALEHNQHCGIKTRRRPPFYFKLKSLFDCNDINPDIDPGKYCAPMFLIMTSPLFYFKLEFLWLQ